MGIKKSHTVGSGSSCALQQPQGNSTGTHPQERSVLNSSRDTFTPLKTTFFCPLTPLFHGSSCFKPHSPDHILSPTHIQPYHHSSQEVGATRLCRSLGNTPASPCKNVIHFYDLLFLFFSTGSPLSQIFCLIGLYSGEQNISSVDFTLEHFQPCIIKPACFFIVLKQFLIRFLPK